MIINLYIANLGKYNEGELVGGWIQLPFSDDEFNEFLTDTVEIDSNYEEYAIHDYETNLDLQIGEYTNIRQLNELVDEFSSQGIEIKLVNAILESGYFGSGVDALIEIIENIDDFALMEDVMTKTDVGIYYIEEMSSLTENEIDTMIYNAIDFDVLGRDFLMNSGYELTDRGLLIVMR